MIKKYILPLLSLFILSVLVLSSLYFISPAFIPSWTSEDDNHITQIVKGFYAEKDNSLDVLFMGNSDIYRGIAPMNLWDEYGMASYAYTSPGQRGWTSYYLLKDALRSQKPKLIVLNVDGFQKTNLSTESCTRKALDNMEMSSVKLAAISDDTFEFSITEKLTFIFPVLRYHSRYSEITKEDIKVAYTKSVFAEKGQDMIAKIKGYKGGSSYMADKGEKFEFPEKTRKYMDMIIEECNERKIDLLLVEMPSADSWSYAKSIAFSEYAKEKNVDFLDLNTKLEEMNFDWKKYTPDKGDHLNIYGADVTTTYLGKYIKEHYQIPDHSNDDNYKSEWNLLSKEHKINKEALISENNN